MNIAFILIKLILIGLTGELGSMGLLSMGEKIRLLGMMVE